MGKKKDRPGDGRMMFHSEAPLVQVFATNLKRRRTRRELSVAALAQRSGYSPVFIQAVETAGVPQLRLAAAEGLAGALGLGVATLLKRDFPHSRDAPRDASFPDFVPCPSRIFTPVCIRQIEAGVDVHLTLSDIEALARALPVAEEQLLQEPTVVKGTAAWVQWGCRSRSG